LWGLSQGLFDVAGEAFDRQGVHFQMVWSCSLRFD
jgi:hypothetical protein